MGEDEWNCGDNGGGSIGKASLEIGGAKAKVSLNEAEGEIPIGGVADFFYYNIWVPIFGY